MPSEAVSASIASRFEEIREHSSDTKRRRMEELYPKGYLIAVTTTPAASDIGMNPKLAENMELVIKNLKYGSWKPDHLFLISLSPPKVPLGQVLQGVSRQALKVLDLKREVLLPRIKEVFAKATRKVYPWTWPILLRRFTNDRSPGAVDELIKRLAEVMRGPQELDELPAREAADMPLVMRKNSLAACNAFRLDPSNNEEASCPYGLVAFETGEGGLLTIAARSLATEMGLGKLRTHTSSACPTLNESMQLAYSFVKAAAGWLERRYGPLSVDPRKRHADLWLGVANMGSRSRDPPQATPTSWRWPPTAWAPWCRTNWR